MNPNQSGKGDKARNNWGTKFRNNFDSINWLSATQDKCVHTEHCCVVHGCKYGKEDCPVETGQKRQSFPCEDCDFENLTR